MLIRISKDPSGNSILCIRKDGTFTRSSAGPSLPHHDLAHYAVETCLGMKNGFYGMIEQGYDIAHLSDKNIIKTLGPETWLAEIVTRALQSHSSGACTSEQFAQLIALELNERHAQLPSDFSEKSLSEMAAIFRNLLLRWKEVPEGGFLVLSFETLRTLVESE